jgi:type IV fimbrial biogenesis protein FimT
MSGRRLRLALGFTLVELLMTLCVAAVLFSVAVPSVSSVVHSVQVSGASNAFLASLRLARSEAFKRGGRVVLCKSGGGHACALAGGWEQGWIMFHDLDSDGALSDGELVLERAQPLPAGIRFTGNQNVARYVSFVSVGGTRMAPGGLQAGTLTLCSPAHPADARHIVLNSAGRTRVEKVSLTACD